MSTASFPGAAVEWIVLNNVISDTELAQLSNVSRKWREHVVKALLRTPINLDKVNRPTTISSYKSSQTLLTSLINRLHQPTNNIDDESDSFCIAWFSPEGVCKAKRVLEQGQDNSINSVNETANSFQRQATLGDDSTTTPITNPTNFKERGSQSAAFDSLFLPVVEEWRGLRAFDVLHRFGYTFGFMNELLNAIPQSIDRDMLTLEQTRKNPHNTDALVRGATVARPEGYCLCHEKRATESLQTSLELDGQQVYDRDYIASRAHDRQKTQRELEVMRELLPRVVENTCTANATPTCVQFLNDAGDHAVCMMTPPFQCGPIPEPITIFCVGIATEDGCFLSGLYHRFEFGHLYPPDEFSEQTELSPICLATEHWEPNSSSATKTKRSPPQNCGSSQDGSQDNSDSGFCSEMSCECIFEGACDKIAALDHDPHVVRRGRLGPGSWHVYVAVFDGTNSRIRIDGMEEPIETNFEPVQPQKAVLDGLTIGSDHCFGISLCCGQGEERQGAIAEVAVFRGCMNKIDIKSLESQLMTKHCISKPQENFREVNEMQRSSKGLFYQVENPRNHSAIPLRYMTKHREVAWELTDPVTREVQKASKIGVRKRGESSDW